MPSAKELAKALAYRGEIRNTPQNSFLGGVANFLAPVSEFLDRDKLPESIPFLGGMSLADLGVKGTESLVRDMSYGTPPIRGASLQTAKVDPRLFDLASVSGAMMPVGKALGKAAAMKAAEHIQDRTGFARLMPDTRMGVVPEGKSFPSQMSEYVPGVKSGDEMLVTHNLTAEKLYGADRLGGMPVPSLGISKLSSPLEGFGDITFVGGREMAVPSKVNPVYKSDAYTKRRPEIQRGMDNKSSANLTNMFGDLPRQLPVRGETELEKLIGNFGDAPNNKL
jgi:hypothetical protein